jgi:hypothetical protein
MVLVGLVMFLTGSQTYKVHDMCTVWGGWVDGWVEVKAVLWIAYSNKKGVIV